MVYNGILMETIGISVMVSIVFFSRDILRSHDQTNTNTKFYTNPNTVTFKCT